MRKVFSFDGPITSFIEKLANLLWLNILWLICCIPVITIGASTTAMYYVALKMTKNEESYIVKSFFKAFKQNFKQSTIAWIYLLLVAGIVMAEPWIIPQDGNIIAKGIHILILVIGFLSIMMGIYIFPLVAKFDNTIKNQLKNALILSLVNAPFTLINVIILVIPIAVAYFIRVLLPLSLLIGGSVSAYLTSFIFNRIFAQLISNEAEKEGSE